MSKKIIVVCLLCVAMNAQAVFYDGNDLVKYMRGFEGYQRNDPQADLDDANRFMGYVVGVADTVNGLFYCPPQKIVAVQVLSVVAQFMNANPARWQEPASFLVIEALKKAFPCPKKQ